MADLRFVELVLLSCEFETWPDSDDEATVDPSGGSPELEENAGLRGHTQAQQAEDMQRERWDTEYPTENLLRIKTEADREDDEFYLYVRGRIQAPRLPFRMRFQVGARFQTSAADATTAEDARSTLFWLAYPFIRELVYNITSRSPLAPYSLPPLTRLPDPRLLNDQDGAVEP